MKIENLSLAEIVKFHPKEANLFDKMQLDFCCKGKQKLKMLETDIHKHFHLENNILFPKAVNNNKGMPKMCIISYDLNK